VLSLTIPPILHPTQIEDLRSSIVRTASAVCVILNQELWSEFRDIFEFLLPTFIKQLSVKAIPTRESAHQCITKIIRSSENERVLKILFDYVHDRDRIIRTRIASYTFMICETWRMATLLKNLPTIFDVLKETLVDGESEVRNYARATILLLASHFPNRIPAFLQTIDKRQAKELLKYLPTEVVESVASAQDASPSLNVRTVQVVKIQATRAEVAKIVANSRPAGPPRLVELGPRKTVGSLTMSSTSSYGSLSTASNSPQISVRSPQPAARSPSIASTRRSSGASAAPAKPQLNASTSQNTISGKASRKSTVSISGDPPIFHPSPVRPGLSLVSRRSTNSIPTRSTFMASDPPNAPSYPISTAPVPSQRTGLLGQGFGEKKKHALDYLNGASFTDGLSDNRGIKLNGMVPSNSADSNSDAPATPLTPNRLHRSRAFSLSNLRPAGSVSSVPSNIISDDVPQPQPQPPVQFTKTALGVIGRRSTEDNISTRVKAEWLANMADMGTQAPKPKAQQPQPQQPQTDLTTLTRLLNETENAREEQINRLAQLVRRATPDNYELFRSIREGKAAAAMTMEPNAPGSPELYNRMQQKIIEESPMDVKAPA
jgi:hypothetical protein